MIARLLFIAIILGGCTHSLHVSQISEFSPTYAKFAQGQWVTAESEQFVVLGFVQDTNYVNEAYRKLEQACAGGAIQSIQTDYSTDHGFFSWTNRIRMQGLCIRKG